MGFQGGPSRPGITYSCWAENERAALTRLIDRFARLHHLALQLHPQRCKERQMWYLASCQDTSFFLKVRHTSPAALSRVLLSVTTLPSALKMPFSNMVKEEWVIQRENRHFFPGAPQNGIPPVPPYSTVKSCPQSLRTTPRGGILSPVIRQAEFTLLDLPATGAAILPHGGSHAAPII